MTRDVVIATAGLARTRENSEDRAWLPVALHRCMAWNEMEPGSSGALLLVSVSNLPVIKDLFGGPAVALVIEAVERRLKHVLRGGDAMGRIGEDRFGIMLMRCEPENIISAEKRFLKAIRSAPVVIPDGAIEIQGEITVSVISEDGLTPAALIAQTQPT